MISAVASLITDFVVPLVSGLVEMCVYILVASVRPWLYLLSPSFRSEVNARYAGRHPLIKWWSLIWGSCLVIASPFMVYGLFWFWSHMNGPIEPQPNPRRQAVEKIENAVLEKLTKQPERASQR
ncbi:MAG: hypothetical protein KIS62_10815 [Ramlibacter sp.]|nr:hypothetical protein [Ramlibacter sp.]MCW5650228.1 hypothetical protein [Ramlibacter sp.]